MDYMDWFTVHPVTLISYYTRRLEDEISVSVFPFGSKTLWKHATTFRTTEMRQCKVYPNIDW